MDLIVRTNGLSVPIPPPPSPLQLRVRKGGGGKAPARPPSIGGSSTSSSSRKPPTVINSGLPITRAPFIGSGILFLGAGGYYYGRRTSINRNACQCECVDANKTLVVTQNVEQDGDVDFAVDVSDIRGFAVCYGLDLDPEYDPCTDPCPQIVESQAGTGKYKANFLLLLLLSCCAILII
ncbi:hypothetical protein AYI68_g6367 [Smittium mucronatum]|uniref:Uncharacterized protein n=1 Tax=Smittium mucronatum TaxID=133383 RepID=A0A1R0GRQ5_9FUNG|nr:hypothetical protein AYI68_g6367 [Smittium mucronatum]